jgi:SAM-dependent methyltransferase
LLFAPDMRPADARWYEATWIYRAGRAKRKPLSVDAVQQSWAWRTFLREAPFSTGRLLDVGCGQGDFLYAARQCGFDVEGVEFQNELAQRGTNLYGLPIACTDIWALLAEERRFDVVTAFEIVEHVGEPVALLRALGRVGRYVAVSVPGADREPPLFSRGFDDPPHHLTLWTERALRLGLAKAGLAPILVIGDCYEPAHLGTYVSCLLGGNYPFARYARAIARRAGTRLGRLVRPSREGAFTLFALAESEELAKEQEAA